jgi:hypothetical protein
VFGSVPVPEQIGQVWNPITRRILVRIVIAVSLRVLWSGPSAGGARVLGVAGHQTRWLVMTPRRQSDDRPH